MRDKGREGRCKRGEEERGMRKADRGGSTETHEAGRGVEANGGRDGTTQRGEERERKKEERKRTQLDTETAVPQRERERKHKK